MRKSMKKVLQSVISTLLICCLVVTPVKAENDTPSLIVSEHQQIDEDAEELENSETTSSEEGLNSEETVDEIENVGEQNHQVKIMINK